ncbi:MAG TPA: folylpolyglutamate synthase/dihydrofolate synthase family protein [Ferruginibacter sp.]|nr:bifunctional folylpolyglutamate synthase/dihydrofolate synthase [Bacteroidota bacterium]HMT96240.1 folylpolyglutamate synthase/dihydrofolate synthase family protein [Ferruginibacter sp.]HMU23429.1 folylpolyglutamate synthase/dihydrofolate synthase family protein [Ferruginibacter sp.]HRD42207.1 folylpolyglutamate synthase/dihydrofolate synthase family protein [Ferruginibacter sp.]
MTYEETITYLYNRLPLFSHTGSSALKKGLGNILQLCEALKNPQNKFKSIHIAGTNGKGSTSNMLAAILQKSGYKTGLYTSPHLFDFGERIRVNGQMVNPQFVIDFTEKTRELCHSIEPSFFELTVAMAFEYFAQEQVDIAVIETGLGGRLDSTNIITPVLSIITNIGFDHMQILGNSLTEIAMEKAGIIKKNIPVVIGTYTAATKKVFEQAAHENDSPISFAQDDFMATYLPPAGEALHCEIVNTRTRAAMAVTTDLAGLYQVQNLCTLFAAIEQLRKQQYRIDDKMVVAGLQEVKKITGLRGRWDILSTHPTVIVDVGHNEDGIKNIIHQLQTQYPNAPLHFILGFAKDKNLDALLELFPKTATYYFSNAHIPRALPHNELKALASKKKLSGQSFDHINDAFKHALQNAAAQDVIMICGSFFVIAELSAFKLQ